MAIEIIEEMTTIRIEINLRMTDKTMDLEIGKIIIHIEMAIDKKDLTITEIMEDLVEQVDVQ